MASTRTDVSHTTSGGISHDGETWEDELLDAVKDGEGVVVGQTFTDKVASGVAFGHAEFEDVTFTRCSLDTINVQRASFTDCSFVGCDLTGADLRTSYWKGCTLTDCASWVAMRPRATCSRFASARATSAFSTSPRASSRT